MAGAAFGGRCGAFAFQPATALAAGTDGDLGPLRELLDVLSAPYDVRPGLARFAEPAPDSFAGYQTFCGT